MTDLGTFSGTKKGECEKDKYLEGGGVANLWRLIEDNAGKES